MAQRPTPGHLNDLAYLPFAFVLSDVIQDGRNELIIRIDNRIVFDKLPVATKFHDGQHGWFPYGGIYRPLYLEHLPKAYPQKVLFETNGEDSLEVWVQMQNLVGSGTMLKVEIGEYIDGRAMAPDDQVVVKVPPLAKQSDGQFGWRTGQEWVHYQRQLRIRKYWSTHHGKRQYTHYIRIHRSTSQGWQKQAEYRYNWALKSFELAEGGRYLLNDRPMKLRGINRHEDHYIMGPVYEKNLLRSDMAMMQEIDVNFCRPGHYPNDVRVLQEFDRAGIAVVEEIPVYQLNKKQLKDPQLLAQAKLMLHRMIIRDFNRPSIVMWSIGNEIHYFRKAARPYMQALHNLAKRIDPNRETFQARLVLPPALDKIAFKDRVSDITDLTGLNNYHGWYYAKASDAGKHVERIHKQFPEQHFVISEFGAGAKRGTHIDNAPDKEPRKRHSYSEEFQVKLLQTHLEQYKTLPYINGVMPWVFADFRMQWTPNTGKPHPRKATNLKGIVDMNRNRKAAFKTLYEFYSRWR